jgi:hypothetical protein
MRLTANHAIITGIIAVFVLTLLQKDLPPNITRIIDVSLGGILGLTVPKEGGK